MTIDRYANASPGVTRKAARIVADRRVHFIGERQPDDGPTVRDFDVEGDTDTYRVTWDALGMECPCRATRRCSHEVAVALWAKHYRIHEISISDDAAAIVVNDNPDEGDTV